MSETFWKRLNYIVGIGAIGVVFGLTTFMASLEVKDLDLWLHLKMGKYISEHHVVPSSDVLSCTISGKPWVNHEWLFQTLVYQIGKTAGFNGLINMQVWVVFITFLILLLLGYSKDRQFLTALFLMMVLLVYQSRFTIRPDIFSLLFFSSFVWILSWFIDRRWSLYVLVIIQILWTNMHGFFFFGPLLVAIALISEFIKRRVPLPWEWNDIGRLTDDEYLRLKKLFPILALACCVNPLTFKGAWYPIGVFLGLGGGSKIFFMHITELQRPITAANIWTQQNSSYKAMIVISAISLFFNRRKIDISTVFIWVFFLLFSLAAIRNMVFFAVAFYMVTLANALTIRLQDIVPFRFSNEKFKFITGIFFKILLILWMLDSGTKVATNGYFDLDTFERKSEFWGVSLKSYPYHAVNFLVKNQIKGNFFNDFNSGAYLIGRCSPEIKVYIDGRTEEYGGDFFEHYQKVWKDGDEKLFLADVAKYNLTGAFLNNNNQSIPPKNLKMFYNLPDWKVVYFDYDAVILLRDVPANKAWIDRFAIDLKKWQPKPFNLQKLGTRRIEVTPFTSRAYILTTFGIYDPALKELQEALKVTPDDFDSFKNMGVIYEKKGDARHAFENFRLATILRPYDHEIRLSLAKSYESLKDYMGAKEQYDRVVEVAPNSIKGHIGLARAVAMLGYYDRALDILKKAPQATSSEDKVDVQKIHDIIDKNKKLKNKTALGNPKKNIPAKK
jgi:tetratricopeptide (TPR) repeat protein